MSTEYDAAVTMQADERNEAVVLDGFTLTPGKKYRLKRQMYLFPGQEVSAQVNDYLKIGAVVTYIKSGGMTDFNGVVLPWVFVQSEKVKKADMGKGREGWCFAHFLEPID